MDSVTGRDETAALPLPAIRNVDLFPLEHDGQPYFCMSDPAGIVEDQLLLSYPAAAIAAQLDGQNTLRDVRQALQVQLPGVIFSDRDIAGVVNQLDTAGFLQTENFGAIEQAVVAEFRNRPTRAAHHAGRSYPADAEALRAFLNEQFLRDGGPGRLPNGKPGSAPLPGLIVPHIDLPRGGHSYAHGYLRLYESGRPHTVVIFGVAHAAEPVPFILTRKPFETPLGTLEVDEAFLDAIEPACDFDPYAYEFTHKTEHSIEFQAVMLAHLYGPDIKIVPILPSYFIQPPDAEQGADEAVAKFLAACREAVRSAPYPVTVVGGADLAHVGPRFGDAIEVDEAVLTEVRARDAEDLAHAYAMRPEEFYRSVMRDDNARHVCGYNCVYSTVKSLEGIASEGTQLHYDRARDPAGGVVSFASAAFHP